MKEEQKKMSAKVNISVKQKQIKLPAGKGTMEIIPFATFGKAGKALVTKFNIPEKTERRNNK